MEIGERIKRLILALNEHQRLNPLHNDKDSYLYAMAEWAFADGGDQPKKSDYGLE
ncbi:MAG: hypothetical protein WBN66_03685 [Smithella sp.]